MSNLKGIHDYTIAEHPIRIEFLEDGRNDTRLLPSFAPFEIEGRHEEETLFFQLTVDDTMRPEPKERRERIRKFDTGNGETVVDLIDDGGYQYIIKDINGAECCLLRSDKEFRNCRCALNGNYNMRSFGLNNALMLIFAFAGSRHDTLLIHASLVRQNGYGYAFIAKSGTGKSTHVSLWLRHLPGCDLMNDDNPVVRISDDNIMVYGSPWSGKTPCYRNVNYPIGAIVLLSQAPYNKIQRMGGIHAYASLMESISGKRWDSRIADGLHQTQNSLVMSVPMWHLECLPDEEAATMCFAQISN